LELTGRLETGGPHLECDAMTEGRKDMSEKLGKKDRWPSDYGERDHQLEVEKRSAGRRPSKKVANIDEQGDRANVRQNTPQKGPSNKR
jgi:hypothetical protein